MDLKNLITFIHVAELGSFTKAADEMGYSQSTVSFQIKQLEEELNIRLFERINHTVMLTQPGSRMLQYALNVANLTDEMKRFAKTQQEIEGHVRIATAQSLCEDLLGENYVQFRNRYPGITMKIMACGTEEMFRMLNHNEVDLVLTLDSHIYLSEYVIAKEEQIGTHIVMGNNYPLDKDKDYSLEELVKEPWILTEKGMSYRKLLDEYLAANSLKISPILEIDNTYYICQLLDHNVGLSFLPDYVTMPDVNEEKLSYLPMKHFQIDLWKQLLYHRDKWISPAVQAVIEYIEDTCFDII